MNVVFSVNVPYPLGMAGSMRVRLFAEYLARQNHYTSVLVTNSDNGQNQRNGILNKVKYMNLSHSKIPYIFHLLLYPIRVFICISKLRKKDSRNILIVYGDIDFLTMPVIIFAKLFKFKVVVDVVEDRTLQSEALSFKAKANLYLSELLMPITIKLIDGLVVISSYLKQKFEKIDSKILIKLIPVSAANLLNTPPIVSDNKDIINLVYCGSFGVKDGLKFLLDAFDQASNKYPNLHLTLVGTPSEKIQKQVSLANNINVTGYLDDSEYWKKLYSADILCMTRIDSPFANAGFPFKLGEYLATGRVVIATDVGDVKNYLVDKRDALIVSPSSAQAIDTAIDYFISNINDMPNIGVNGFERSKEFFNPSINSKMLETFIGGL